MINRGVRYLGWGLAGWVLAGALGSCGKVAEEQELQLDSNTNWLKRCDSDDACSGALRCYCGQCTQPCAQNDECGRLAGAECAASGSPVCEDGVSAGGLCVLACAGDDACGFDFTCTEGQCVPRPCRTGSYTWDDVFEAVADDLRRLDADDAPFARYFSLANRWSSAPCDWSITAEGQALSKLVNSLSNDASITAPVIVDQEETLFRIDLRDYVWDVPVVVDGVAYDDAWEALVRRNTYALPFLGDDAESAVADTGTTVPVMFVSAFIATATEPDVYYALAGVPQRLDAWLDELGFELGGLPEPNFQAGFVGDRGVEFVAQHFPLPSRAGYLWKITELGREEGDLFRTPLAAPLGQSEIIVTQPNGFHAFAYMSSTGDRIDEWAALVDAEQSNGLALVPRTHFRRHDPGVNVTDQVHELVLSNPGNFESRVYQAILQRYRGPDALADLLASDLSLFTLPALTAASVAIAAPDPITRSLEQFEGAVTLEDVAGDLLLTVEDLRDNLELLEPALRALADGPVPRETFTVLYADSLCKLSLILENQPDPNVCP